MADLPTGTGVKAAAEPAKKVRAIEAANFIIFDSIDVGGFCRLCVWYFVNNWITGFFLAVYQAVKRKQTFCRDVL